MSVVSFGRRDEVWEVLFRSEGCERGAWLLRGIFVLRRRRCIGVWGCWRDVGAVEIGVESGFVGSWCHYDHIEHMTRLDHDLRSST